MVKQDVSPPPPPPRPNHPYRMICHTCAAVRPPVLVYVGLPKTDAEMNNSSTSRRTSRRTSSSSAGASASASAGEAGGGGVVDATGHVALCITDELWTLSGIEGVSDLVTALTKILTSLPLPEDDQVRARIKMRPTDRSVVAPSLI